MTREELAAYGKRKYGKGWMALLAEAIGYSASSIIRVANGRTPKISRRMELEIKELRRRDGYAAMLKPDVQIKYE